jgi:hypothetical protein
MPSNKLTANVKKALEKNDKNTKHAEKIKSKHKKSGSKAAKHTREKGHF